MTFAPFAVPVSSLEVPSAAGAVTVNVAVASMDSLVSEKVTVTGTVMVPARVPVSVTSPVVAFTDAPSGAPVPSANVVPAGMDAAALSALSVNLGVRLSATPAPPDTAGYSTLYFCALDFSTLKVTVASSVVLSE